MANDQLPNDLITLSEAAELLGVSRPTMGRIVLRVPLRTYPDPTDARAKLVSRADVRALRVREKAA
jgi:predicted DNA-binding transcriptional regulator AlpA